MAREHGNLCDTTDQFQADSRWVQENMTPDRVMQVQAVMQVKAVMTLPKAKNFEQSTSSSSF